MDEIVLGQSSVGFRPSEAPRRFKQKAISITQASPGSEFRFKLFGISVEPAVSQCCTVLPVNHVLFCIETPNQAWLQHCQA